MVLFECVGVCVEIFSPKTIQPEMLKAEQRHSKQLYWDKAFSWSENRSWWEIVRREILKGWRCVCVSVFTRSLYIFGCQSMHRKLKFKCRTFLDPPHVFSVHTTLYLVLLFHILIFLLFLEFCTTYVWYYVWVHVSAVIFEYVYVCDVNMVVWVSICNLLAHPFSHFRLIRYINFFV